MVDTYGFFLGIDLGSGCHQAVLLNTEGLFLAQLSFEHRGTGMDQLLQWLDRHTGSAAPQSVAVALEAPRGAVIDALLERSYHVFSINPKQLDRFRDRFSVAGAKDDRRDALVLAHSLRTDRLLFRPLTSDDPRIVRLRELSRAERSIQEEARRCSNQLWSYLQRYFPALLKLCPGADEFWLCDLLACIKARPAAAARLPVARLKSLLLRNRIRRFSAEQLREHLRQGLPLAPGVDQALAEQVLVLLPRLQLLLRQQAQLARSVEQLLDELAQAQDFSEHRSVEILRSIPGFGRVATATVLAEVFTPLQQRDYHYIRLLAGVAPVTRQSGNSCLVSMRQACNDHLRNALFHASLCHAYLDPRAHQTYTRLRQQGQKHGRALRGVGDRLLELAFVLLRRQTLYDPKRRG